MKALMCDAYGPAETLHYRDVEEPEPGAGEVRLRVLAAGVNFPDTLIIENKYQFKPPLPFAPGGECIGVVEKVGADVSIKVGTRVLAVPGWGTFAEKIVISAQLVIAAPESLDANVGAGLVLTYGTSHYALKQRGRLKKGETLLVLGAAGGVGTSAIAIGKAMGARVIAAASSDEKLAFAKAQGADEIVKYGAGTPLKDAVKKLAPEGVDVIYDPVGGPLGLEAVRLLAWGGRFLVIGFAGGTIQEVPANLLLLKGAEMVGVFWGAFTMREQPAFAENMRELFAWIQSGAVKPQVSEVFALEKGADAISLLAKREAKGKVVITVSA